jgi:hypothetical protein
MSAWGCRLSPHEKLTNSDGRRALGIRWKACHPVAKKSFVKYDGALRYFIIKRQDKKKFLWNALMDQIGNISEAQLLIVIGVVHQGTAFAAPGLQQG